MDGHQRRKHREAFDRPGADGRRRAFGLPGRRAQGHRRIDAARLGLPISDHHRHLRRRGERDRPGLGRGAFPALGVRHRAGVARLSRAPCVQGRRRQHAAVRPALDAGVSHRRLAGASAAFVVRQLAAVESAARAAALRRHSAQPVQGAPAGARHLRHLLRRCGFGDVLRVLLAHRAVGAGVPQGRAGAADLESLDGQPVHSLSVPAGAAERSIFRRRRHAPDLALEPGDPSGRESAVHHRRQ